MKMIREVKFKSGENATFMAQVFIRFAWFPIKMDNGDVVWFKSYHVAKCVISYSKFDNKYWESYTKNDPGNVVGSFPKLKGFTEMICECHVQK